MNAKHTRGWYLTRIELAIGIAAVLFPAFLFLAAPGFIGPGFHETEAAFIFIPVAGGLGIVVGFAWMVRIFRGPRDEPPWRYRDR